MILTLTYAQPEESHMYAYWRHKGRITIILDNLSEYWTEEQISNLVLQETLCQECNNEDYNCTHEYCPYEKVIFQLEN